MSCETKGVAVEVDQVTWGPKPDHAIISDISLSIAEGDRVTVIGANGAGKSSLLRCIFRAAKPVTGSVRLDGKDIWQLSPREAARKVAAVLQETPSDFPFSVLDIVLMGRIPHCGGFSSWSDLDHEKAHHALEHLDLQRFSNRAISTLSGGERQRVLVARALAQDPGLIVLDEPTNHLDIRYQLEILDQLKALSITVITALHDINLAADFADKIALMAHGRLLSFGAPEVVLTDAALSHAFGVTAQSHSTDRNSGRRFSFSLSNHQHQQEVLS